MLVGLCTPCYSGMVHNKHMLSVIATMKMAGRAGIKINHYVAPGCPVLPRVRNRLVSSALADQCDYVAFTDDDIAWRPEDFFKLLNHDVDIVAAAPPKRHKRWDEAPAAVLKWLDRDKIVGAHTKVGRIWQVAGLATGFMAIKANVFERMKPVTQPCASDGDVSKYETRNWFWHDLITVNGQQMDEGEDYSFCRKFREVGGQCWVDPDIRVEHYVGNLCHDACLADAEIKEVEAA